jgi:probable F420-dependent oxidoreductase
MEFGVMLGVGQGCGVAYRDYTNRTVPYAEKRGFDSVWAGEHIVIPDYEPNYPYTPDGKLPQPPQTDFPDPLIWLAHAGALTTSIKLATGVLLLPQHNPVVLAKTLATVDRLAEGRLMLGVGVGWMREEAETIGVPFQGRGARAEEFICAMRALWTQDAATYHGQHVGFSAARSYPKPASTDQRVPILIGGSGKLAARRAGRLGDGYYPVTSSADQLADLIATMHASAEQTGRDPNGIEVSVASFALTSDEPVTTELLDQFHRMEDLGVHRIVVPRLLDTTSAKAIESMDRLGGQLIKAYH